MFDVNKIFFVWFSSTFAIVEKGKENCNFFDI